MDKECSKCHNVKSIENFPLDRGNVRSACRLCQKAYLKQYRIKNFQKLKMKAAEKYSKNRDAVLQKVREYQSIPKNAARHKEMQKRRYNENPQKFADRCKKYREKNRDKLIQYSREYYSKNKSAMKEDFADYYRENIDNIKEYKKKYNSDNMPKILARNVEYVKRRKKVDLSFRLSIILRVRLSAAIRGNQKAGSAVQDLGCSIAYLKEYLESKFQPGMTWDNYGNKVGQWSIDHIMPLSKFDLTDREQFLKACHYTNLQPLWHLDNIKKSNKIP